MKRFISQLSTTILLILATISVYSQATVCEYFLVMEDLAGDTWNGASVTIDVNGTPKAYTLDGIKDDGRMTLVPIVVSTGQTLTISLTSGTKNQEVSLKLYNAMDSLLMATVGIDNPGVWFVGQAVCPSCQNPRLEEVSIDDVRAFFAKISWRKSLMSANYLVEYGPKGFLQGTGTMLKTRATKLTINGLLQFTDYDFYLSSICMSGDTSGILGPFSFKTLWAKDLGIIDIVSPQTACAIPAFEDSVKVVLKNFGGEPHTFIPFKYSVNGEPIGIPIPRDGYYTGVLGKDSIDIMAFETLYDFSNPNDYLIEAWTEIEGDTVPANDTFALVVTNVPILSRADLNYAFDFETWSGGWTVAKDSKNSSWARAMPKGNIINGAAGGKWALVTNPGGDYNNEELSYILSPCLDFSGLTADPTFTFAFNFLTEQNIDKAWLEMSLDSGEVWSKIGKAGEGVNWYNNVQSNVWDGNGGFDGWTYASHLLNGIAGAADARLRFVFSSDITGAFEGMALDNVSITLNADKDLALSGITHKGTDECGSPTDNVSVEITNLGSQTQNSYFLNFSLNGGKVYRQAITNRNIRQSESLLFQLDSILMTEAQGVYDIKAWVELAGDVTPINDTLQYRFVVGAQEVSYIESFESGKVPFRWSTTGEVSQGHNNSSYSLSTRLNTGVRTATSTSPLIGEVLTGDSLVFYYKIVNYATNGATAVSLGANDRLLVEISTDCGTTFSPIYTINASNHMATLAYKKVSVDLAKWNGGLVKFRFSATWGSGDYWIDVDDFAVIRCPQSLGSQLVVKDETTKGTMDGAARIETPQTGTPPFNYLWSNGNTGMAIDSLSQGEYTVSITDHFGCSETLTFNVGLIVGTREKQYIHKVQIAPNPTSGLFELQLSFIEPVPAHIQILDMLGREIWSRTSRESLFSSFVVDLGKVPGGVYLVRINVKGGSHVERLVKSGF